MTPALTKLRELKFFWLLVSLILLLVLTPVVEFAAPESVLLRFLFGLVLLASVRVASVRRSRVAVAAFLALVWLVLVSARNFLGAPEFETPANVLLICLLFYTLGVVLVRIISYKQTDFDILCGAVSVYLLIGVSWAVSYRLIETVFPGSFSLAATGGGEFNSQYLYYSFTTLTTLGYGDVTPLNPIAQMSSVLEAVTGVLYIALLVARLVGLYRS